MAKDLKSILAGVKSSKIAPPGIDGTNFYQPSATDGIAFIKKHKIETHADRVGNGDDVYKGKTKKTDKYKFQSDGVYEETEEDELDEAARVRFIGKQNPADLPPLPADYKPGDFGSKLAAQGGLRYPGKKKPSRPLPVKESEINEGNKENKAKKKAVMADKPKEKEKEFDPREFFSAARRGRQMEENFDGMKSLKSQIGLRSPKALTAFVKNKKDKKLGEGAGCNHTMEGVMCEVHGESACPTKENDVNMQKSKKKDSKGREYLADKKKVMEEVQYIEEVLTAKDPVSKWIHDFVHSDNPKFSGKTTKERQKMALGAYYNAKRGYTVKGESAPGDTTITVPGAFGDRGEPIGRL